MIPEILFVLTISTMFIPASCINCKTGNGLDSEHECLSEATTSAHRSKRASRLEPDDPILSLQNFPDRDLLDCDDLQCVCPYLKGRLTQEGRCILPDGQPLRKAIRKEYRMMTSEERDRFNSAIRNMKRNGEYDILSNMHRSAASNSGAHSGPSFLLWHREFIKRFELALRRYDPLLAMPYWDNVMDNYLTDPRDSILFSNILVGDTDDDGHVISGPFGRGFQTLEGNTYILRELAESGKLMRESSLETIYAQRDIEMILAYTAPKKSCPYKPFLGAIEYIHSSTHLWIGGDMRPPLTSANDPIFLLHHSFIDLIFENWRQRRQDRISREQEFPPEIVDCATTKHFSYAPMIPFNKRNIDGLANSYTDNMYEFAPRASCTSSRPSCDSDFLFCDTINSPAHCVSKIKNGGNCYEFYGLDACYRGRCVNGRCEKEETSQTTSSRPSSVRSKSTNRPRKTKTSAVIGKKSSSTTDEERCLNHDPCCDVWRAEGRCSTSATFTSKFCQRSCGLCKTSSSSDSGCTDRHPQCNFWSSRGECHIRQRWMAENCPVTCQLCHLTALQRCRRGF